MAARSLPGAGRSVGKRPFSGESATGLPRRSANALARTSVPWCWGICSAGSPTTFDRLLALRFGAAAVRLAEASTFDHMVALISSNMQAVPLAEAIKSRKKVDLNSDKVMTAREIGICLGDWRTWKDIYQRLPRLLWAPSGLVALRNKALLRYGGERYSPKKTKLGSNWCTPGPLANPWGNRRGYWDIPPGWYRLWPPRPLFGAE